MRSLLSPLPTPLVQRLRRVRASRPVQRVSLARQPQAAWPVASPRRSLELGHVWRQADPEVWQRVQQRLDASGIGHVAEGINPGDRRALSALVGYLNPQRVLEIGTHIGASTVTLAATLANSSIVTVDLRDMNDPRTRPWEAYGLAHSPAQAVAGLAPVEFVVADSLSYLASTTSTFDFIFLDGDHRARTVYREIPLALSRLRDGGVILLHDYFPEGRKIWPAGELAVGPWLATERLRREGCPFRILPLGTLPWPTKLGSHATSLALLLS